ncbi:MAG TPA: hypothetical protein VGE47_14280 [Burkholderiaceae bacterium]
MKPLTLPPAQRSRHLVLALKIAALIALAWGLAYPGLLWSLKHVMS